MRFTLSLFLASFCPLIVSAAPTIDGVDATTVGTAQIYTDSNDSDILWVTPPSSGLLELTQDESLIADPKDCEGAAIRLERKLAFERTIFTLEEALLEATIAQASGAEGVTNEDLVARAEQIDILAARLADVQIDESLYLSAGTYSYRAVSGMNALLEEVRLANPDRTVLPIRTSVTAVVPSLTQSTTKLEDDRYILNVGVDNFGELASAEDNIQIDVQISRLAACYIKFPEIMSDNVEPFRFGFSINYEYPFLFAQRVTAEYNLSRTYQRIETIRNKRRFFSSSVHRSVVESTELASDLNVVVVSDKPLSQEVQFQLEAQAREIVLNVAVTEMIAKFAEAGTVPPSGASVAAGELSKACGTNPYCQGAGAALTILDSIFGGSTSRSELLQQLDHNVTYTNVNGETLPVHRSISYVAE